MQRLKDIADIARDARSLLTDALAARGALPQVEEVGRVISTGRGIATARGLRRVRSDEILTFAGGASGMAFNLDPDSTGIMLLDESSEISAGSEVKRTFRPPEVPVGDMLLGRVVDPRGRPRDGGPSIVSVERRPVEAAAPPIIARSPVSTPLQTGIKVIDALLPLGRGQRELILGDRQTGKTSIAVDTILNQKDTGVLCIYCAIGQEDASVAQVIDDLRRFGALDRCIVVVASGNDAPGLQYIAPYAATAMGEYFRDHGEDALIVYDELTQHAQAYREISLLFRRPPAREAYPGDIFYIHSRLLERATHLDPGHGGGSLTALPIVQTEAQNIAAYLPTNLISITDGQIYLSPTLFQKGILPAVEVGTSVSRVGGKAQRPAYRAVASEVRLSYAQFEELEAFSRFGTRLEENTRKIIEHGRRIREVLKQPRYRPLSVAGQTAVLLAATAGLFDGIPIGGVPAAEEKIMKAVLTGAPELCRAIEQGGKLSDEDRSALVAIARAAVKAGSAGNG